MPKNREQKINRILQASLKILSAKGYENATIADIAKAANVSRGILHYYFSDKEDLVSRALASSSSSLVEDSLKAVKGNSVEEVVDGMIDAFKKNLQKDQDFYAFLFEMWCAGRRNKRIKKELHNCSRKVVGTIKESLEIATAKGVIEPSPHGSSETAAALLALSDGIAFQLLNNHPENIDAKYWLPIRTMMLAVLKK